ncbi:MAG: hypothetical protein H6799_00060 [Candidatus Nomurabacteria bacterium]|nr:MAG: hypothetical protein H6799_00060 [Candidatus Nomurabacteria bacterium]HRV76215.1 hypothetical protein [Candidatus Saccharimonadales bacterium]
MESDTPFRDSLLKWGRSGSFYPILLPDPESNDALRAIQAQIAKQFPAATLSKDLHSTFFYLKPAKFYEKLLEIKPGYDEAQLYLELSTTMSNICATTGMYPLSTDVLGLDRYGPNDEVIALKLADMGIREDARKILRVNLGYSGFGKKILDILAEEPAYQWVFGPSDMHISLASGVKEELDETKITMPKTITFDGIGDGSVQAPGDTVDERYQWYLMGV